MLRDTPGKESIEPNRETKRYVEGAKDKSTISDNSRKKRDCRRRKEELEMETAASPTAARWGRRKSQITEEWPEK